MSDITVIFYTANQLHEPFAGLVRQQLLRALGDDIPLISVSQQPMAFGHNICVGDIGRSHLNIYRQILIGVRAADTPYVAMAEDDMLYLRPHFTDRRPSGQRFLYNLSKLSVFTWTEPPMFSWRNRMVVNSLIADRAMLEDALEERFFKFEGIPDAQIPIKFWGDPGRYERQLGVTVRDTETWWTTPPNIIYSHEEAYGYVSRGSRKAHGPMQAYTVPYWGWAGDMQRLFLAVDEEELIHILAMAADSPDYCQWAADMLEIV